MKTEELIALRPTEKTLAGIADSRARIALLLKSAKARIAELESNMPDLMMNGTAAEINAAREETTQLERSILELTALDAAVKDEEQPVRRANALVHYCRAVAVSEEKTAVWIKWFLENYAMHASEIASGMKLEQNALAAWLHALAIRRQHEKLLDGAELPELPSPKTPYSYMRSRSFSGEVQLPGVKGGPFSSEQDEPFWVDPLGSYQHQTDIFLLRNEIADGNKMIAQLQQENAGLRAQLSAVGRPSPVTTYGAVVLSGAEPSATSVSWDAAMKKAGR